MPVVLVYFNLFYKSKEFFYLMYFFFIGSIFSKNASFLPEYIFNLKNSFEYLYSREIAFLVILAEKLTSAQRSAV